MKQTNLAAYLAAALAAGISDHTVRAHSHDISTGIVQFYVHPSGQDGETLDFVAKGNRLTPRDALMEPDGDIIPMVAGELMTWTDPSRALLERVKAWRDSSANDAFPHELRAEIDAVLAPLQELQAGVSFESELEAQILATKPTAPRLTPEDIDAVIVRETYTVMPSGRTTVCELTLRNGFTVRGESSVVCIENFNAAIGERNARENARNKIWELEGYLLQDKLHAAG